MFRHGRFNVREINLSGELLHYRIVFSFYVGKEKITDSKPIVISLYKEQAEKICERLNKAMESDLSERLGRENTNGGC